MIQPIVVRSIGGMTDVYEIIAGERRWRAAPRACLAAAPVTLAFRDPEGTVLLRPVDAATGEVLAGRGGVIFTWIWRSPGEEPSEGIEEAVERTPGWLKVEDGDVPEVTDLRLIVPGYLPAAAPPGAARAPASAVSQPAAICDRPAL